MPTEEGMRILLTETDGSDQREALFRAASEEKLPILKLERRSTDLEDFFLRVTEEAYRNDRPETEEDEEEDDD